MRYLLSHPERVRVICAHIVAHFRAKVEPNGFKAQVVTFDRECCVLYKHDFNECGPDALTAGSSPPNRTQAAFG